MAYQQELHSSQDTRDGPADDERCGRDGADEPRRRAARRRVRAATTLPLVALVHGTMDRSAGFAKVATAARGALPRACATTGGATHDLEASGRRTPARLRSTICSPCSTAGLPPSSGTATAATSRSPRRSGLPGRCGRSGATRCPCSGTRGGRARRRGWRPPPQAGQSGPEEAAELFLRRILGDERWERLPEPTRHERRAEGHALVGELVDLRNRPPWTPEDVAVPVLVGHGTKGAPHHVEGATFLVEHLPRAKLVVIEGAGHNAHTSHPEAFARFVEESAPWPERPRRRGPRPAQATSTSNQRKWHVAAGPPVAERSTFAAQSVRFWRLAQRTIPARTSTAMSSELRHDWLSRRAPRRRPGRRRRLTPARATLRTVSSWTPRFTAAPPRRGLSQAATLVAGSVRSGG